LHLGCTAQKRSKLRIFVQNISLNPSGKPRNNDFFKYILFQTFLVIFADMATREEYIRLLRRFLSEHGSTYGIRRIGIFGSVARGEQTEGSDVDVLVEAPVLDLMSIVGIKRQLEDLFGSPVDVVRKTDYMPPRFRTRVEREVIYV
jgi:predicted nucleotidyltransferase